LVEVKAQLRFVGEDAEAALKQKDEVLRAKLPGQTNEKKNEKQLIEVRVIKKNISLINVFSLII
jgi:hypothetical protein